MSTELIGLVFRKMRVSNATKAGLVMSYIVFQAFDIEGRVKRALKPDSVT